MVWVFSIFRLKAPPGISSSCISPLTSSGQRSRASWASQPQKSATLSPQPGGKPRKFIRTCGGIGGGGYWSVQYERIPSQFRHCSPNLTRRAKFTKILESFFFPPFWWSSNSWTCSKTLVGCRHKFDGPHATGWLQVGYRWRPMKPTLDPVSSVGSRLHAYDAISAVLHRTQFYSQKHSFDEHSHVFCMVVRHVAECQFRALMYRARSYDRLCGICGAASCTPQCSTFLSILRFSRLV